MNQVRLGVIGCGGMANNHMSYFDKVPGLKFVAASDNNADNLNQVTDKYGVKGFAEGEALIDSGEADAVLIATPHYFHPVLARAAFKRGVHVLTEKPVAVTAKDAEETNRAYEAAKKKFPNLLFAAMFNQRTRSHWLKVKQMVDSGQIGELIRISWTVTTWFRTQAYYDSGGWRATWKGEGGGVLINQCPHNLDLFQWFVGMPKQVQAMVGLGKHHDIEVEDDVVAMMQFDNGAVGTFITSTGEAPGVNRLEIAGDNGTLIVGDGPMRFLENTPGCRAFCRESEQRFATPQRTTYTIEPGREQYGEHEAVTRNFINVLLGNQQHLVAQGTEGIHGLELGNAMLMSSLRGGKPVEVPTPREEFHQMMQDLINNSTFQKKTPADKAVATDLAGTF